MRVEFNLLIKFLFFPFNFCKIRKTGDEMGGAGDLEKRNRDQAMIGITLFC